ncbi:YoaK family protein [Streptosporangium lutulentum]|uniref:Uncharacterized membrane protein YoaK (UPF0700 family) n=1 Tax=Streptosporangium lutulentum TaxID=1461250 RepID=A0ABT9QGC3_9ACTN|nr:YoaK family protein [Streptosporangium lutulentum]MDP9845818.1 uncharacterized membrane protein YoaK (UPF0700 family) [Streptosporangium lutulentum]
MFTIGSGTAAPSRRRSYVVLVFMTLAAGAMDAVAFLGLGGIFTANMTGNLILLALVGEEGWEIRALRASLACVVFCVGLLTGFGMPKRGRVKERWPAAVTRLLWVDLLLQTAFLVGWVLCEGAPGPSLMLVLIALGSFAMGIQAAAARRVDIAGITTTFVTGTLTALAESLASRNSSHIAHRAGIVLALVCGALCASLLLHVARLWAAAVPLVFMLTALAIVMTGLHARKPRPVPRRG